MTEHIKGISSILNNYDIYFIDMSGVIYNGIEAYPHSIEALNLLKNHSKQIILLTNAPRPQAIVRKKLNRLGFNTTHEKIITSGDFFIHELNTLSHKNEASKPLAYILGADKNQDLNLDNFYAVTDNIEEAQLLILLTYVEALDEINIYDHILEYAAKKNIPAICPNPDTIAYHGNMLRYPAGSIANRYESLGGSVTYYGKPYSTIYKYALKNMKYDKSRLIAIGDNLNTDILGAKNFGIDSLLISKGIYKNIQNLDLLLEGHKIFPTYICDYLKI